MLYPLLFTPQFVSKVWGGKKIKNLLQLELADKKIGEAWMLSGIKGKESVVMNGFLEGNNINELMEIYMGELVGDVVFDQFGNSFPLLLKILDANEYLSIQVHPPHSNKSDSGKSELWYVLESEEKSEILIGFNEKVSREEVSNAITEKNLSGLMNSYQSLAEDLYYIPEGRIHGLGPGNLLLEIQQASDTTYRLYDWERTDRELHLEEGLSVLDYEATDDRIDYPMVRNMSNDLGDFNGFSCNLMILDKALGKDYAALDSFVIYQVAEGKITVNAMEHSIVVPKGYCVLLPADCTEVEIFPEGLSKILEISI